MPLPASRRSPSSSWRHELPRLFEEHVQRTAIALVIVLRALIARARADEHAARCGLREVRAQMAGRARKRVDQAVQKVLPGARQLGVFASHRIDAETARRRASAKYRPRRAPAALTTARAWKNSRDVFSSNSPSRQSPPSSLVAGSIRTPRSLQSAASARTSASASTTPVLRGVDRRKRTRRAAPGA